VVPPSWARAHAGASIRLLVIAFLVLAVLAGACDWSDLPGSPVTVAIEADDGDLFDNDSPDEVLAAEPRTEATPRSSGRRAPTSVDVLIRLTLHDRLTDRAPPAPRSDRMRESRATGDPHGRPGARGVWGESRAEVFDEPG